MIYPVDARLRLFKISLKFTCQVRSDSGIKSCVTIFVLKHGVNLTEMIAVQVYDYADSVSRLTDTLL